MEFDIWRVKNGFLFIKKRVIIYRESIRGSIFFLECAIDGKVFGPTDSEKRQLIVSYSLKERQTVGMN